MITPLKLKKMDKKTTVLERKAHKLGRKVRLGAKIGVIMLLIGLALWLVTKFNSWSLTHKIVWQSPIILRTFVYIEEVKPEVEKVKVVVTPTPTSEIQTLKSFPKYLTNEGNDNRNKALVYLSKYYSGD